MYEFRPWALQGGHGGCVSGALDAPIMCPPTRGALVAPRSIRRYLCRAPSVHSAAQAIYRGPWGSAVGGGARYNTHAAPPARSMIGQPPRCAPGRQTANFRIGPRPMFLERCVHSRMRTNPKVVRRLLDPVTAHALPAIYLNSARDYLLCFVF